MIDEKDFNRIFSENLSMYMLYFGLKQVDLAKMLKVSTSTVSSWINEQRTPRMKQVDQLCKLFHCKRSDLISEDFEPPSVGEDELLTLYRQLNTEGKEEARKLVQMLVDTGKYKKHSVDEMAQDA